MGRTPAGETRDKVFRFVRDRLAGGHPPTVRDVMEAFGFRSPQTAREHLDALIEEGRLAWAGCPPARSIRRSRTSKGMSPCRPTAPPASCSGCA